MLVRPIFLDVFWDYFFGRPYAENGQDSYAATQHATGGQATLASDAAADAIALVCTSGSPASALLTPGQPVAVGTQGLYDWQQGMVASVVSDTVTVYPRLRNAVSAGAKVMGSWYNSTHPTNVADSATAFASWLANAKRAGRYGGGNLIGRSTSKYTDATGEANVPMGWLTGRSLSADGSGTWTAPVSGTEVSYSALTYTSTTAGSNTSDGNGFSITTSVTAYQGLESQTILNVTPGKSYCLSWKGKVTQNTAKWVLVDADSVGTVVATSPNMGLGANGNYLVVGMTEQHVFTVPSGVFRLRLRMIENFTGGVTYIDWVRLLQVDDDEAGQYVLGSHNPNLAVLGDSWGVQVDTYLDAALAGRGITVTNNSQSGWRIDQLNAEFSSRVPATSDACLLLASTNDVAQGATVAQLLSRIATFCDLCEAANIQPIIMGVPPLGGATYSLANSNTLNNAVRNYVWSRAALSVQDGLTVADILAGMKADADLGTSDGGMVAELLKIPRSASAKTAGAATTETRVVVTDSVGTLVETRTIT